MTSLVPMLLRGVVLSLAALLLLTILRRRSGETRHRVATVAFATLLLLPFLAGPAAPRSLRGPIVAVPPLELDPGWTTMRTTTFGAGRGGSRSLEATGSLPLLSIATTVLAGVYLLGAAVLLFRLVCGWRRAARWACRAHPLVRPHACEFPVRISQDVRIPLAVWAGRGIVLLPPDGEEWSSERLDAVLRHESAHLERGDLATMLLARLTLVLHWPNPLVWKLAREARRAAEDAADDAVLRSGLAPDRYASHLLELARCSKPCAGLALAIAHRSDLGRRIHRMLHPRYRPLSRRSQGFSSLAAIVATSTVLGAVGLVGVAVVQTGPDAFAKTSWAPDVRTGRSKAATPANGFVGTLSDGRQVTVDRICMAGSNGVECWTPDGRRLPGASTTFASYLRKTPHSRAIVTRFPSSAPNASGALGSSSRPGKPSALVFAGGSTRRVGDHYETTSLIEVPKEDSKTASFTLGIYDEVWEKTATLAGAVGAAKGQGIVEEPEISALTSVTIRTEDARGRPVTKTETGLLRVSYFVAGDEALRSFRVFVMGKDGRKIVPLHNEGGYRGDRLRSDFYFQVRAADVSSVQIDSHPARHLELIDLRITPNR